MRYHCNKPLLLVLMVIFINIELYAQNNEQNSDKVYDITIISKGHGCIFCNEQFKVDNDDRKEFTLKNNADVRLRFSPNKGCKLSKFTINGIIKGQDIENNQITLKGISRKTVIVATFDCVEDSVRLTLISGLGGTLFYNNGSIANNTKTTTVKKGSQINLRCNPQKGFKLEKFSINGVLRDVAEDTYSFEIRRNSVVKVAFVALPSNKSNNQTEQKPKFVINVCGPGKVAFSGEINGVVAGNPESPFRTNKEEFHVTNGSDVTMKLTPVQNIKRLTIGYNDLTQTVKSSDGLYTVGVTHEHPESGLTSVSVEFTQRYKAEIYCNEYGSYKAYGDLQKTGSPNIFIINKGGDLRLWLEAKKHCHIEKLTINGIDMSNKVNPSSTVVTGGGPTYDFNLGKADKDYKIEAKFAPDPKLTIVCGQYGNANRALDTNDPTGYIHYLDPEYIINPGQSKTFYEPSAAKSSNFNGKEWILRMYADVGYKLSKLVINGIDMTSRVIRYSPNSPRNNRETCFISLGFIKQDTKVEISFKKEIQQAEWVDLGTGVKWATCNVGAEKPTDFGNYCTWKKASALNVQKGRLPALEEINRLMTECHPKIVKEDGVEGVRFYHRSDNQRLNKSISIFIPAAGLYSQTEPEVLVQKLVEGAIWTSTDAKSLTAKFLDLFSVERKWSLAFNIKEKKMVTMEADAGARMSVRLVLDK